MSGQCTSIIVAFQWLSNQVGSREMQNEESYHMQFDHLHSDCIYDIVFNNTLESVPPAGLCSPYQDPSLASCKISSNVN